MDWAGQSGNTVNLTNLLAGTHCGNGIRASAWTATVGTNTSFSFVTDGQAFPAPLNVCGTAYPGNSNVALDMHVSAGLNASGYWSYKGFSNYANIGVGSYLKAVTTGVLGGGGNIDIIDLKGNSGSPSYNLQLNNIGDGANLHLCGENDTGGGAAP